MKKLHGWGQRWDPIPTRDVPPVASQPRGTQTINPHPPRLRSDDKRLLPHSGEGMVPQNQPACVFPSKGAPWLRCPQPPQIREQSPNSKSNPWQRGGTSTDRETKPHQLHSPPPCWSSTASHHPGPAGNWVLLGQLPQPVGKGTQGQRGGEVAQTHPPWSRTP